jgi:hypothetical protein
LKGMEPQSPDPSSTQTGDAESKMRRNLGLDGGTANGSAPSSSNDPMKVARQAIRSQVVAREYTERQLVQAQTAIQDLRTKLRHVHHERESAISAAQSAMTARDAAERTMRAAETALATERATRVRTEGMLRNAETTIRDLRAKLGTANQNLHGVRAELGAERQARQNVGDGVVAAPETAVVPARDVAAPTVRRPVGRPRKIGVVAPVEALIVPSDGSRSSLKNEAPPNQHAAAPTLRRPVGRPRKTAVAQPVEKPIKPSKKAQASAKVVRRNAVSSRDDDQEPIQWWIKGWKER